MKITNLIPKEEILSITGDSDKSIIDCTSKYQNAHEDSMLFLLPGVNFDTKELIPKFLASRAKIIVTESKSDILKFDIKNKTIVEVKSSRLAYAYALSKTSDVRLDSLKFIGVTGTNGKTSTATMIAHILEYAGKNVAFIGTGKMTYKDKSYTADNYSMTTPDPEILYPTLSKMQNDGCEIIVMEASSHALELEKLSPIKFDIGIFTGLSHEHLDFHKTMEKYFISKEKLIKKSDAAIINIDDSWGKKLYEKYKEKSTGIGVVWRSDVSAYEIVDMSLYGIAYILRGNNFLTRIKLPLPGLYNVYNSMMAFEAAYKMNVSPKIIKEAFLKLNKIEGRCEIINSSITVIIDYAHTPKALENLLDMININKKSRQSVTLVFGCGGNRDAEKRPQMAEIAEKYADRIIVTNDNPRTENEANIFSDIISGFKKKNYSVIPERSEAIKEAIINAADDDFVVIAGKGHEKYIYDKNGYHYFNEREIVDLSLKLRSKGV